MAKKSAVEKNNRRMRKVAARGARAAMRCVQWRVTRICHWKSVLPLRANWHRNHAIAHVFVYEIVAW